MDSDGPSLYDALIRVHHWNKALFLFVHIACRPNCGYLLLNILCRCSALSGLVITVCNVLTIVLLEIIYAHSAFLHDSEVILVALGKVDWFAVAIRHFAYY